MIVDLNADLGEGCANDQALLQLVSSANIACGFHAGDAQTMRQSVRWALQYGVAIGAHPSFPDRENFGRTRMQLPPETVYAQVVYQLGALAAIARAEGGVMVHVKPHGMLYNQAAVEPALAEAIARAVQAVDPALRLVADPLLFERFPQIAFNAGRLDRSIILDTEDYLHIARPEIATFRRLS